MSGRRPVKCAQCSLPGSGKVGLRRNGYGWLRSATSQEEPCPPDHPLLEQPPLPVAEKAGAEVLSLPLSPAHSEDDVRDAIDAVHRVHATFNG